jgi:hypothetical protein
MPILFTCLLTHHVNYVVECSGSFRHMHLTLIRICIGHMVTIIIQDLFRLLDLMKIHTNVIARKEVNG